MHEPLDLAYLVPNLAGSLLLVALGAWVWTLRPRTAASGSFAVFAAGVGASFVLFRVLEIAHPSGNVASVLITLAYVTWPIGLLGLLVHFPRRLGREDRAVLLAAGLVIVLYMGIAALTRDWSQVASRASLPPLRIARGIATDAAFGCLYGLLVGLAVRMLREPDPSMRRQIALTSAGVLVYAGAVAARGDPFPGSLAHAPLGPNEPWLRAAVVALVGAIWLLATRGPDARLARNVALLTFAVPFYGLAWGRDWVWANPGISRAAMVVILAYAIVRHQLLGIDVKVRWAISKSTIAAAFVAAFFLASEGAQLLFGQDNEWVGLVGAGALVFALAPLQRAAERLAERAVPIPSTVGAMPSAAGTDPRHEAYKAGVRAARADGVLTPEEELHLADLQHHLALAPREAVALRHEVEREHQRSP